MLEAAVRAGDPPFSGGDVLAGDPCAWLEVLVLLFSHTTTSTCDSLVTLSSECLSEFSIIEDAEGVVALGPQLPGPSGTSAVGPITRLNQFQTDILRT